MQNSSHRFESSKGRVVFQGNQVYDQNHNYAIFQDLGSSPATLQAAKAVDFFGCLPNHVVEIADAEQAYIQADMKGDPTWICLPPEARPDWWRKKFPNLRRPVCRLLKALYGHPDAGTYWEQKCDAHVQAVGFVPIGPEWPSCYYLPKLSLLLSIYVDDFEMAGLKANISHGWKILRQGLHIDPEQRITLSGVVYLGCRHIVASIRLLVGVTATTMTYDMEDFLKPCIARYREAVGIKTPSPTIPRLSWPRTTRKLRQVLLVADRSKSALGVTIRVPLLHFAVTQM
jgi:hypothetical protein